MQVGLIGLGKMGLNLALNMRDHGHEVIGYARTKETVDRAKGEGIKGVYSLEELVKKLIPPRLIWLMVPAGETVDMVINQLIPFLSKGDIIVDGGNSYYRDTLRRYEVLKAQGLRFADIGTSGGIEGARWGICAMVGAEEELFQYLEPLLKDISAPGGYLHTGPCGSGHFVKMVHNGIEYGMMQAIGEGMEILAKGPFKLDLPAIARVWRHGSVIRGWLMDLTERVLSKSGDLKDIRDVIHHSGEGLWTVEEALRLGVPVPVISLALMVRFRSEQEESFAGKVVAALRHEFGGHEVERKAPY
ncbi:6-phosphogluconate dehydrogenase (decarboxylating) [Thermanaeromonas toyohensis ToBE]|uniref:6-phosphogluconate dehydrogenase (Decarboxylating) n=1 Tax=Thermanaeromonas toyohensis ToBE TaxID=698762 RepID=A0A1W1W0U0_9FIRM|nr:decarboxylating 6-phosphogluconate dehydrogenase [Thermanaeromonas toyohensis]SMB98971.1 6-phosphogluconate dehydrogenase (decarboxylating) [Thermanaeromonas toyohensis ToBE]